MTTEELTARIAARRLDDGRIEFALEVDHEAMLPDVRYFPPAPTVGRWLTSSDIVRDGVVLGKIAAQRLSDGRTEFSFVPPDGERIFPPSRYFPAGNHVTDWLRSRSIELFSQRIQNPQTAVAVPEAAALPAGVPTFTNLVNVRARYHPSEDEVEMFIVDVNTDADLKVDSRDLDKAELEDGAWHSLDECVEVSNWQCVTPLVRLANGQYEFGVQSEDSQVEPLYPSSRWFAVSEFEKGAILGLGGWGAFKETSSVAVPGLGAGQCEEYKASGAWPFDDWVTVHGDTHVKSEGGVYHVCRGRERGLSAADAAFTAAVQKWLLKLSHLRDSRESKLSVKSAYDFYEEAKDKFDAGILPNLFGEFLKWPQVFGDAGSGGVVGALSQLLADEVQRTILDPINEATYGSNTDFYFDAVPAYYQLGARVDLIGWRLDQWEKIETKVERGDTLSYSEAQTVYAAWRELRAVAEPAAMAVRSAGFTKNLAALYAIGDKIASFLPGAGDVLDDWDENVAADEKIVGNPAYYSTFTEDVAKQDIQARCLWTDVSGLGLSLPCLRR